MVRSQARSPPGQLPLLFYPERLPQRSLVHLAHARPRQRGTELHRARPRHPPSRSRQNATSSSAVTAALGRTTTVACTVSPHARRARRPRPPRRPPGVCTALARRPRCRRSEHDRRPQRQHARAAQGDGQQDHADDVAGHPDAQRGARDRRVLDRAGDREDRRGIDPGPAAGDRDQVAARDGTVCAVRPAVSQAGSDQKAATICTDSARSVIVGPNMVTPAGVGTDMPGRVPSRVVPSAVNVSTTVPGPRRGASGRSARRGAAGPRPRSSPPRRPSRSRRITSRRT